MSELSPHDIRRVAVVAITDPRTVANYVSGRAVRSTSETRIVEALRELGREDLIRQAPPATAEASI